MDELKHIIIVGDIHGRVEELNRLIQLAEPDIILQVGDFGFWPDVKLKNLNLEKTKIYWCDGNHEHHDILQPMVNENRDPVEIVPNCFYMPRGSVKEFNGKNIMFLGGADSIDKAWRKPHISWFEQELLTEEDYNFFRQKKEKIDIIISHTAPNYFPVERKLGSPKDEGNRIHKKEDPTRDILDKAYDLFKPSKWYFGHWHFWDKDVYESCTWTCLDMCPYSEYDPVGRWFEELSNE